jgi:hypothetical protein
VRAVLQQHLAAAAAVRQHRHEIGHRPARHESAGFLAGALGSHGFELLHGLVAVARIVAEVASRMDSSMASVGRVRVSLLRSIMCLPGFNRMNRRRPPRAAKEERDGILNHNRNTE